jgi:hypothetical protein
MGKYRTGSCNKEKKEIQLKSVKEDFKIQDYELFQSMLMYVSDIAAGEDYETSIKKVLDCYGSKVILYFAVIGMNNLSLRWKENIDENK